MTKTVNAKKEFDAQLLYEISYDNEEVVVTAEDCECRPGKCRYCKSLDKCEFGMYSLIL